MQVKEWFKKNFHWIAVAASVIAGFFIGRKSLSGNIADYERVRAELARLQELLESNKRNLTELIELKSIADDRIKTIEGELESSRREIESARARLEQNDSNIKDFDNTIKRLRSLTEKHRTELESIQVSDSDTR